jgi:hypothetical protein
LNEHNKFAVPTPSLCRCCNDHCSSYCQCACHTQCATPAGKALYGTWLAQFLAHCHKIRTGLPFAVRCVNKITAGATPHNVIVTDSWADILSIMWGLAPIQTLEHTEATLHSIDAARGRFVRGTRVRRSPPMIGPGRPRIIFEDDAVISTPGGSETSSGSDSSL